MRPRPPPIQDDGPLSMDAMLDNLLGIVFAGHDTTAITAANILALLAVHPDWAMRLVEEQRRVVQVREGGVTGQRVCVVSTDRSVTYPCTTHPSLPTLPSLTHPSPPIPVFTCSSLPPLPSLSSHPRSSTGSP